MPCQCRKQTREVYGQVPVQRPAHRRPDQPRQTLCRRHASHALRRVKDTLRIPDQSDRTWHSEFRRFCQFYRWIHLWNVDRQNRLGRHSWRSLAQQRPLPSRLRPVAEIRTQLISHVEGILNPTRLSKSDSNTPSRTSGANRLSACPTWAIAASLSPISAYVPAIERAASIRSALKRIGIDRHNLLGCFQAFLSFIQHATPPLAAGDQNNVDPTWILGTRKHFGCLPGDVGYSIRGPLFK